MFLYIFSMFMRFELQLDLKHISKHNITNLLDWKSEVRELLFLYQIHFSKQKCLMISLWGEISCSTWAVMMSITMILDRSSCVSYLSHDQRVNCCAFMFCVVYVIKGLNISMHSRVARSLSNYHPAVEWSIKRVEDKHHSKNYKNIMEQETRHDCGAHVFLTWSIHMTLFIHQRTLHSECFYILPNITLVSSKNMVPAVKIFPAATFLHKKKPNLG